MRVTESYIRERVETLSRNLHLPLWVDKAYGKLRVMIGDPSGGANYLSPRLSSGQVDLWLDGFEVGLSGRIGVANRYRV